ncbi:NAD(P)-dependent dehydrogenase (short-subunit alcohol dehydrogenase family) [Alteromonadaceae bacterium 2753L.S.0a.02]|nr:NAD(P)-dependent dehydrogenase (short-subunit alcohol dehydrogenase family) [Alteromonadaceae bacterium 2753L.S.0a.02]
MIDSTQICNYQAPANLLSEHVILVTGAGDGIGKTAALAFAQHGATVILLGRTLAKLEAVYDHIENQGFAKPAIIPMNFESATEQEFAEIHNVLDEEFGRLDGLLHNAAELGPRTPLANYPLDAWQKLLQVNVTAPFELTKALLPLLKKSQSASVVFTSAAMGREGRAYWGAYAVSKGASENLMQTLADEVDGQNNIRVNSIDPGAVRTRMRATAYPAEDPSTVITPDTIMNRYLYLMGQDSAGINGQQFNAQ